MTPVEQIPIIRLHDDDDVAVARCDLAPGQALPGGVVVRDRIPAGHKLAIRDLAAGDPVRKYHQIIGRAACAIAAGSHVHGHNLAMQDFARAGEIGADARPTELVPMAGRARFRGIVRADGRVATRNYVGIVTTVNCSATVARRIKAEVERGIGDFPHVDGVVAITHGSGCGMAAEGEPIELLRRTLRGYARHVNFAGVLVLGLGCETNQIEGLGLEEGPALRSLAIQDSGGTARTVAAGAVILRAMLAEADKARRQEVPASHLIVGLQCGGSDGYSGITANPALGAAVDLLVRHGGSAILSETPEIYGAEHLLTRRATPEVAAKLMARISWWEEYTARNRGSMDNNPSPGNKAGGLTTILEKSLGAAMKGGTTNLVDVVGYAEPVTAKGLVFMDTPGFDPVSATGQVAGGANLLCFTTGRGSVFGAKPAPCLKLATNTPLYLRMTDDIDIDCGPIADGLVSVAEMGERIFRLILATASGTPSKSELLGFGDEEFQPWQLDAVM
jgi:altronate hydrolase